VSWRQWFGGARATRGERERDIEREIRAHLELEAEERQDAGMSAEDARHAAERAFGNRISVSEEIRAISGTPLLDAFLQDVRYAVRMLRRAPAVAAIAVGSSAVGIGACSVIFAILNVAVLRPLPVEEARHLMSLSEIDRRTGEAGNELSYPDFRDLRQARSLDGVAASDPLVTASIGLPGDPQRHWGALVTANYFTVVKPRFEVGRGFDAGRDGGRAQP
jgi:putative ABC transport system permease protein